MPQKIAFITGGNRGLGFQTALDLSDAGVKVIIGSRDLPQGQQAIHKLRAAGADADVIRFDITQPSDFQAAFDYFQTNHGRLDILINNAGMSIRKPPQDYAISEWQAVLDTNLTGAFACAQAAYAPMKEGGGGKIINIGSMMSIFGGAYAAPYSTSKGGLVQLTKSLATAWAKDNIQVNAVLPGWIDTELTRDARVQVPGLNERVLNRTPVGRWGVPEDLAGIAVFLAAPASEF
jgi:2-deoxy-D-gluconate 3-dehydrogenase